MPAPTSVQNIALGVLRYTTDWWINETATYAGPITISLNRKIRVAKPGGGHDMQDVAIPPQTFRLINQTISDGIVTSSNDDGQSRRDSFILVGKWDADMLPNDTWEDRGGHYKIDGLLPNLGYEARASVTAFDVQPDYGS